MQSDLQEVKAVKRLARILFKREIADARAKSHMGKMRVARSKAFDDDSEHGHSHEYRKMDHHRRASIRFGRIASGHAPFKTIVGEALSLPHFKGTAVAAILAKKHDRIANKYAYSSDAKKLGRHERAAQRYARIAKGKNPYHD